jgi:YfiH family protein
MAEVPEMPLEWLTPQWPAPPGVRALSSWRGGGVSGAPFESLNLGGHVGDRPEAVAENRRRLCAAVRLPGDPVWLSQQHGAGVLDLDAPGATGGVADASVTRRPGRVCAILTADCLPILIAMDSGGAVAAIHAGWRGLAAGVIEAAVQAVAGPPRSLLAWLGPGIGRAHFEIGSEVREALLSDDPAAGHAFEPNARGRYLADLALLARRRLERLGIERIYGGDACTYASQERYFSHRRDGRTGRQASLIWLER